MSAPRYLWRQLNEKQRTELLTWRKARGYPWHSPPHRANFGHLRFLISASCFEHCHYIGHSLERMDNFSSDLVAVFAAHAEQMFAWRVLPNHYHALVETPDVKALLRELGLLLDAPRNPVRHGYVARWTDWPWSSATEYLP